MTDLELAKKSLDYAKKLDIDEIEIRITTSDNLSVKIENDSLKKSQRSSDKGLSVRIIKNKSVGFSYTTSFKLEKIQDCISNAAKMSKFGIPDPDFHSLCEAKSIQNIHNTNDKNISKMEINEAVDIVFNALEATKLDDRVASSSISFYTEEYFLTIVNSRGVELNDEQGHTAINLSAEVTAKDGEEMTSGFEFESCRFLKELKPQKVGNDAAKMAIDSLNAKRIETTELPVIFHPLAAYKIFSMGIGNAINAESIMYGRSYLVGKKNEQIATEKLSVIDDGTFIKDGIPAIYSSSFDGEGHPHEKTPIIEEGILKSYLHNTYTSKRMKEENTGNASRGSYKSLPSISPTNLVIKEGNGTIDDMIKDCKEGILLIYTGDSPNLVTGDLSALISTGFKIKNGEIDFPLKQTMLGINLVQLFSEISWIGSDTRQIGHVFTPSIRIEKAKIGGK